ncbi:MAG: hypothetical protein JWR52_1168 [Marmoricola sp.]|nr:hypothetical protein [Marmoricola sp.]
MHTVTMPAALLVGSADELWVAGDSNVEHLCLDLSQVTFLDVTGMIYIVARLSERTRLGGRTTVRLPQSRSVREHMRNWDFAKAVMDATGESFYALVHPEDHAYFGEREDDPQHAISGRSDRIPGHYFPIQSFFALSGQFTYDLLVRESGAWQERYVLTVLNTYLGDYGRLIATNVIHEALDNAILHPHARLLQTGSLFQTGPDNRLAWLTIVIWDDGESIVDTLRAGLFNHGPQNPSDLESLHRDFHVRLLDEANGPEVVSTVRSDVPVGADATAHELLLASLFPGVTSRPPHAFPREGAGEPMGAPIGNGMGLHILTNTVLDVFGGSLAIRTGEYFANLKGAKPNKAAVAPGLPPVNAKVVRRANDPFPGNMITMRIPLSPGATRSGTSK